MKISKNVSIMLKGLAALFVLGNHIVAWGRHVIVCDPMVKELFGRLSDLGMFSFLFISGYGLYSSYCNSGLSNYWDKKVKNIYIPMLFANCVGAITYNINKGQIPQRGDVFRGIVSSVIDYNGIMWYIHYLFVWYFLFWVLVKAVKNEKHIVLAWIVTAIFMLYMTPETYGLANEYCLAFPLGVISNIVIGDLDYHKKGQNLLLLFPGFVAMLIAVLFFRDMRHSIYGFEVNFFAYSISINIILALALMAVISLLQLIEVTRFKKIFLKMGEYSFAVYLLQEPLIGNVMKWTDKLIGVMVIIVIGVAMCVILANIYRKTVAKIL